MAQRAYVSVLWLGLGWALANCAYVYLILGGDKAYRIETAILVLLALLAPLAVRTAGERLPPIAISPFRQRLIAAVVVAVWSAIYLPLLSFPFLSDDYVFLDLYRGTGAPGDGTQFFRPVYLLAFFVVSKLSLPSSAGFHALGFGLHLASSYFVFVLASRLFKANGQALLAATVFLLNPLQLEAVLWVSGLQDSLWVFFVLAALTCYTAVETLSPARLGATALLVALALLSKETAVCYVLVLPAADFIFFRFRRGRWLAAAYAVFAIELGAYLWLRSRFVPIEAGYLAEPSRYFIKQFVSLPYRFFTQPWNVSAIDMPAVVPLLTSTLAVSLLFWLVVLRRRSRELWFGASLILASTLPVYSYFFVREDLAAARYLYFAAFGWALIVASLASAVRTAAALTATTLALAGCLAFCLVVNLRPWRVAGDVVRVMHAGIVEEGTPDRRLTEWAQQNGIDLVFRDAIPAEFGGVGIFINGYDGFVRHVTRRTDD